MNVNQISLGPSINFSSAKWIKLLYTYSRIDRLLLVMCVTYLWCYHVGRWVFKTGKRREVDIGSKRNNSFFRIGLDWLIHAIPIAIQYFIDCDTSFAKVIGFRYSNFP